MRKNKYTYGKYIAKVKPVKVYMLPYALAKISDSLHKASLNYKVKNIFPLVNYYLYLSSIEKGLKAAILSKDPTLKKKLKSKIKHDLKKTYHEFEAIFNINLFAADDLKIIDRVNEKYQNKGFEYFDNKMVVGALKGFSDIPDIEKIKKLSKKVNVFLKKNKYFIESIN